MFYKTKGVLKKLTMFLLALCCTIGFTLGLAACSADVKGVTSAAINEKGELVITYTDGTTQNLGNVQGKDGEKGDKGEQGEKGDKGENGRGIVSFVLSEDGTKFIVTYTDGTKEEIAVPALADKCSHENEEILVFEEHTAKKEGTYLHICVDCGKATVERSFRHDYGDVEVVAPTCTTEGYTGRTCTICGHAAEKTDIVPALGHKYGVDHYVVEEGRTICEDGGMSVQVCERCDDVVVKTTEPIGHHSEAWRVVSAPTATNAGSLSGTCANCGKNVSKELPAFNSETGKTFYTYTVTQEKKFCTDEGKAKYSFTIDEQSFEFEVGLIPQEHKLAGKALSEWKNAEENAYDVKIEGIVEFNDEKATCTAHGKGYFACEDCGEKVYVNTYKEHDVKEYTPVEGREATCTEDGQEVGHCAECDKEITRVVPKLGHNFKYELKKTGTDTFELTETCTRCDHKSVTPDIKDVKTEIVKPATCKEEGVTRYTYTKDGNKVVLEVKTGKINHTLNGKDAALSAKDGRYNADMAGIKEFTDDRATCTSYGKGYYECEKCGELVYVNTFTYLYGHSLIAYASLLLCLLIFYPKAKRMSFMNFGVMSLFFAIYLAIIGLLGVCKNFRAFTSKAL